MALSTEVIDRLFSRMAATYGASWDRSLGSAPLAEIKAAWAHELGGFAGKEKLQDVAWALENLPEKVPNVIEFRALCRRAPQPEFKQLPAPTQDPKLVAEVVNVVKSKLTQLPAVDPKDWARKLKARHDKGEKLASHQITAYRQALGFEGRQSWQ